MRNFISQRDQLIQKGSLRRRPCRQIFCSFGGDKLLQIKDGPKPQTPDRYENTSQNQNRQPQAEVYWPTGANIFNNPRSPKESSLEDGKQRRIREMKLHTIVSLRGVAFRRLFWGAGFLSEDFVPGTVCKLTSACGIWAGVSGLYLPPLFRERFRMQRQSLEVCLLFSGSAATPLQQRRRDP